MNVSAHIAHAPLVTAATPTSSGPIQVANPAIDPIVSKQARFRVLGDGPVSKREIKPVTIGAAQLVARDGTAVDAVRRVLRLVEDSAGGAAASSQVTLNGVAFSESQVGLAANTYRAHLDDDPVLRRGVAGMSTSKLQHQARLLGERKVHDTQGMLANVVSGWMNIGPAASNAMLGRGGGVGTQQLGDAVRILLHESQHAAETSKTGLSPDGDEGFQEALAEARSTRLDQLQHARGVLGLDGAVSDAALGAALRIRPYGQYERVLDAVFTAAGVPPGSDQALAIARQPARAAVDQLARMIVKSTGESPDAARAVIDEGFADAVRGRS